MWDVAGVQGELASMRGHVSELHNTLTQWESAVAARDAELQTLQVCLPLADLHSLSYPYRLENLSIVVRQGALGELTYESEAAERLRSELRAAHAAHEDTRRQLAAAQARTVGADTDGRNIIQML